MRYASISSLTKKNKPQTTNVVNAGSDKLRPLHSQSSDDPHENEMPPVSNTLPSVCWLYALYTNRRKSISFYVRYPVIFDIVCQSHNHCPMQKGNFHLHSEHMSRRNKHRQLSMLQLQG